MKTIHGIEGRDFQGKSYYTSNGFTYELYPEYGGFPSEFEFTMYSGGCCDQEDNLFLSTCILHLRFDNFIFSNRIYLSTKNAELLSMSFLIIFAKI